MRKKKRDKKREKEKSKKGEYISHVKKIKQTVRLFA